MDYWYTESTVWVQWPDDRKVMVTYSQPTFTKPSVVDGWPQDLDPQATHGTGTVAANGVLGVARHRVSVGQLCGGKSTQGKVDYWYTETRVWVRWQEPGPARRVMVGYPRPAFAKPSVVDGWPQDKDPQAVPGTGTVGANGKLNVAGHQVLVGKRRGEESTKGKVDYWYTETTVWVQWQEPDAFGQPRRVMATYPQPTLSNPSMVDGWPQGIDPQATPGEGTVSASGMLRVAGHLVYVGKLCGGISTQGKVSYWYTASRVWVQWPDGRQVMVGFPRPTFNWAAGRGGGGPGEPVSPAAGGDAATTVLLAWTEPFSSVSTEQRDALTWPAGPR
ncbi:hypothetical protein ABZ591_36220, partial [Micromonospora fulviviridis]|uniref:hypothetical protein n=1 Tax=Micromonospora fulviviridis TaxID=47860 RepID=UPI0033F71716